MEYNTDYILNSIRSLSLGEVNIMEVCGTHTMAIAKSGIKNLLPENVHLISGPGCPVCVTPEEVIDGVLSLTERDNTVIATYGDMLRVPGSARGDNLAKRKALGARVEIVYSPVDAIELAKKEKDREIVFLGVGFETTAPGTAAAVKIASEQNVRNFSVFSMLKTVEPAIRALYADEKFNVQGFLCPGHVGTIIGEKGLAFITDELRVPAVIAGFEPEDILLAVYKLCLQIKKAAPVLENEYTRAVTPEGNPLAQRMIADILTPRRDIWRGLGEIEGSGLGIKPEYAAFDAEKKFSVTFKKPAKESPCRCGDVIKGYLPPEKCPLFAKVCSPEEPVGPCMVSSEGACAAAYKYGEWEDSD